MVDEAPPPEAVLPDLARLLHGRVLVAHNARFDAAVLRGAFARAALDWPEPPVLCTVAMARRLAPLQRRRGLAALADALGIEVDVTHRALPDAETCARVFCALFGRLAAHAATVGEAVALLGPKRRRRAGRAARRGRARGGARRTSGRTSPSLPRDPGVYVFRDADGHPLYVGKSVCLRTRARAHFTTPADVDRARRARRLPGDAVRARGAAARGPADQGDAPARQQARQAQPGRLRLPALPARHPVPDPRGRARAGGGARGHGRAGARPRRGGGARRAAQLAVRPAPLRPQAAAPRPPERLRADGPLPLALPGRPRPEPLPRAARRGAAALRRRRATAARRCSPTSIASGARRRAEQQLRARRVAAAPARAARGPACAGSAGCCAPPTRARGSCSPRTRRSAGASTRSGSPAGASSTGARCPAARDELLARTAAALRAAPRPELGGWLPPERGGGGAARRRLGRRARAAGARARRGRPGGRPARALGRWRTVGGVILGLDHVQLAAPPGSEAEARRFFTGLLGLEELEKPAALAGARRRLVRLRPAAAARRRHRGLRARGEGAPRLRGRRSRRARRPARRGGRRRPLGRRDPRRRALLRRATPGATGWSSWLRRRERNSTTSALTPSSPTATVAPGSASRRTMASAIGPNRGDVTTLPSLPTSRSPSRSGAPGATGADRRRPRRWRFGLPRKCSRATVSWPT